MSHDTNNLLEAYLRGAAAYKALGKSLEAAEDFEHALHLELTSKAICESFNAVIVLYIAAVLSV